MEPINGTCQCVALRVVIANAACKARALAASAHFGAGAVADHRGRIIWKHARHRCEVAAIAVDDAE